VVTEGRALDDLQVGESVQGQEQQPEAVDVAFDLFRAVRVDDGEDVARGILQEDDVARSQGGVGSVTLA
jgi:hypothetical protein